MKVCALLKEKNVFLEIKAREKAEVLAEMVEALKNSGEISYGKAILKEIMKREGLGSTGLEKGIAVPHALTDDIQESLLALAVVKEGINFDAVDHKPTYILLLLLGNRKNPGHQLKILAHVCRLVKETHLVERLKKVKSSREVCEVFEEEEGRLE